MTIELNIEAADAEKNFQSGWTLISAVVHGIADRREISPDLVVRRGRDYTRAELIERYNRICDDLEYIETYLHQFNKNALHRTPAA